MAAQVYRPARSKRQRENDMTKDEAEIRSIIADHEKAHHAKNVDLLLAHGGEGFLSFDLAPPLQNKGGSPKEARREIEAWFATWKGPIGLEERDLVVTAGDNVAFSTSLTHMTGAKTDGAEVSLWFRTTNGFRKENGKWKIVHAHSSVPFYMDGSSKACLDLKP
jgi:ketosteroid isomerase-like protein